LRFTKNPPKIAIGKNTIIDIFTATEGLSNIQPRKNPIEVAVRTMRIRIKANMRNLPKSEVIPTAKYTHTEVKAGKNISKGTSTKVLEI